MTKEWTPADYEPFCSRDSNRFSINRAWTAGDFTYATNGHILVRTPANPAVPTRKEAPDPSRVLAGYGASSDFQRLTLAMLPEPEYLKVWVEMDDDYDGLGLPPHSRECERATSVTIRGFNIDLRYARLIAALPSCEFAPGKQNDPAYFRFDGGIGTVMGLRGTFDHHVPLPTPQEPTNA